MKRMVLMIALAGMALGTGILAAEGVQEDASPAEGLAYTAEERLEVEGTLRLTAGRPQLEAPDGTVYELMYPYYLAEGLEISSGDTVMVEGYRVPGPRWQEDEDERHLRVETAEVNGRRYNLAEASYAGAPAYGQHSMMGRRGGAGGCRMHGFAQGRSRGGTRTPGYGAHGNSGAAPGWR